MPRHFFHVVISLAGRAWTAAALVGGLAARDVALHFPGEPEQKAVHDHATRPLLANHAELHGGTVDSIVVLRALVVALLHRACVVEDSKVVHAVAVALSEGARVLLRADCGARTWGRAPRQAERALGAG